MSQYALLQNMDKYLPICNEYIYTCKQIHTYLPYMDKYVPICNRYMHTCNKYVCTYHVWTNMYQFVINTYVFVANMHILTIYGQSNYNDNFTGNMPIGVHKLLK